MSASGAATPNDVSGPGFRWDAFISYSQMLDGPLARALRDGLQSMGKSPFALRRARVFLDKSSLAATSDLPQALQTALRESRCLIVLCSPEAARSQWVALEIQAWLAQHPPENLFLVLAAGRLVWGEDGFDREQCDALPAPLFDVFKAEPLWLDLTWARADATARAKPAMRSSIARLAAAVLKRPLDEIEGDDVRGHRTLKRLRTAAVIALAILTACSIAFGVIAERNRRTADQQRQIALQRALASTAQAAVAGAPSLSNAQKAAAHVLAMQSSAYGRESWDAAHTSLQALPTAIIGSDQGITAGSFVPGTQEFVVGAAHAVARHDHLGRLLWTTPLTHDVAALAWAPDAAWLMVVGRSNVATILAPDGSVEKSVHWNFDSRVDEPARLKGTRVINAEQALIFASEGFILIDRAKGVAFVHPMAVDRLAFCDDTATWSQPDGKVIAMPFRRELDYHVVHQHTSSVTYLACAANGQSVASIDEHDVAVWTRDGHSSRAQLRGVRALALAPNGERMAINNSEVQQSGLLDIREGSNETLLFGADLSDVLWRIQRHPLSTALSFQDDWLLLADDLSGLVRVDTQRLEDARARRIDRIPTTAQIDHMVGLSKPGHVLVVTKDGWVDEYDFESYSRRPRGRTTGWAITLELSDDRNAALVLAQTAVADVMAAKKAAILFSSGSAPGPLFFDRAKDVTARADSGEIAVLVPHDDATTRLAWSTPLAGKARASVQLPGRFDSITISASSTRVLAHGNDGAILTDFAGQVLWQDSTIDLEPQFIADTDALLLRSEAPDILPAGATEPRQLPYESGNIGTNRVTRDLNFAYVTVEGNHELWNLKRSERIYAARANDSWSASLSQDESLLVTAVATGGIDVVMLKGEHKPWHIDVPLTIDGELIFTEPREVLVTGLEGAARINLLTKTVTQIDAPGSPTGIEASADGKRFLLTYADNLIRIYGDANQLTSEFRISDALTDTEFSQDGQWIALGSLDGGVRLVNQTGQVVADIRADTGSVFDIAFVSNEWLLIDGANRAALVPIDPYSGLCSRAVRAISPEEWVAMGGTKTPPIPCNP